MKEPRTALYEGMYIVSASLSSAARTKAVEKIQESITSRNGEIIKMHEMGKKRLAYEIKKQREGFYFLIYFSAPSDVLSKVWSDYHLNEDLIRFMTIRVESVPENFEDQMITETATQAQ